MVQCQSFDRRASPEIALLHGQALCGYTFDYTFAIVFNDIQPVSLDSRLA